MTAHALMFQGTGSDVGKSGLAETAKRLLDIMTRLHPPIGD